MTTLIGVLLLLVLVMWAESELELLIAREGKRPMLLSASRIAYEANAAEAAARRDLIVHVARGPELFVDIDNNAQFSVFVVQARRALAAGLIQDRVSLTPSASGLPHRHARLFATHNDLSNVDRIALQLVLGSDPYHEMCSLVCDQRGHDEPTLFFEKYEWAPQWTTIREAEAGWLKALGIEAQEVLPPDPPAPNSLDAMFDEDDL